MKVSRMTNFRLWLNTLEKKIPVWLGNLAFILFLLYMLYKLLTIPEN